MAIVPATDAYFVSPAQLRVGLFITVGLPWHKHDFLRNSFRIRDEKQIAALRALHLPRFLCDPERSDSWALHELAQDGGFMTAAQATAAAPQTSAEPVAQDSDKLRRMAAQRVRKERIAEVERAFGKAVSAIKHLNRNLIACPDDALEEMDQLVQQMAQAFLEKPDATLHVMGYKAGGEDVDCHSLNVTILAMMLAKDMGLSPVAAREMGIGAMLHDVGLRDVPDRVRLKSPDDYNTAERNLRCEHVGYGLQIGTKLRLGAQAMEIIAQHHEYVDGSGYPHALTGAEMGDAAKLVALVNYYDNLCNPIDSKKAMTPQQALSFMFAQRRSKFDEKAMKLLVVSLGVYPPGSIVELSTNQRAMVTCVNPQKPLRPWVMVCDAQIPKEEAPIIDLMAEPDIAIVKSMLPSQLSPVEMAYLNPRKQVTYFFGNASE